MERLNYNHLFYFWVVAREGGITRAAEQLHVSQPSISTQLKELESVLGHQLFDRVGRGLRLTGTGRIAFNYANAMFSLSQELLNALEEQPRGITLRLSVGLADVIPKPVAQALLAPATKLPQPLRLVCREDKTDRLLADLAARRTDLVLCDGPIGTAIQVEAYNHLLGDSGISFFASSTLAAELKRGFPRSLNGMPMLLPTDHTEVRRSLNQWFDSKRIHPVVIGEFDDSSLMFWFGQNGSGIFPAPTVIERQLQKESDVVLVGRTREVRERFYAITLERHPKHPAVRAVCDAAGKGLLRKRN